MRVGAAQGNGRRARDPTNRAQETERSGVGYSGAGQICRPLTLIQSELIVLCSQEIANQDLLAIIRDENRVGSTLDLVCPCWLRAAFLVCLFAQGVPLFACADEEAAAGATAAR